MKKENENKYRPIIMTTFLQKTFVRMKLFRAPSAFKVNKTQTNIDKKGNDTQFK